MILIPAIPQDLEFHNFSDQRTLLNIPHLIHVLFPISLGESVSIRVASKIFLPLLIIGILSVIYWHHTETLEEGDLRIYAMVQFLPIVLIPIMLMIYGSVLSGRSWIISIILCYGIAKAAEMFDGTIYEMSGFSGHSLKHLIAAVGAYVFLLSFKFRKPLNGKELL